MPCSSYIYKNLNDLLPLRLCDEIQIPIEILFLKYIKDFATYTEKKKTLTIPDCIKNSISNFFEKNNALKDLSDYLLNKMPNDMSSTSQDHALQICMFLEDIPHVMLVDTQNIILNLLSIITSINVEMENTSIGPNPHFYNKILTLLQKRKNYSQIQDLFEIQDLLLNIYIQASTKNTLQIIKNIFENYVEEKSYSFFLKEKLQLLPPMLSLQIRKKLYINTQHYGEKNFLKEPLIPLHSKIAKIESFIVPEDIVSIISDFFQKTFTSELHPLKQYMLTTLPNAKTVNNGNAALEIYNIIKDFPPAIYNATESFILSLIKKMSYTSNSYDQTQTCKTTLGMPFYYLLLSILQSNSKYSADEKMFQQHQKIYIQECTCDCIKIIQDIFDFKKDHNVWSFKPLKTIAIKTTTLSPSTCINKVIKTPPSETRPSTPIEQTQDIANIPMQTLLAAIEQQNKAPSLTPPPSEFSASSFEMSYNDDDDNLRSKPGDEKYSHDRGSFKKHRRKKLRRS